MTKKRLLVVSVLLLALLGIGLGAAALIPEGPSVTKANFDRIKKRMTRDEVETIIGPPEVDGGKYARWALWASADKSTVRISFSESGDVAETSWQDSFEPFSLKIRRWLHLR